MATATGFDRIKELAIRSQGRDPEWKVQVAHTGAPIDLSSGVDVRNAIVSMLLVALRADASAFTSRVKVDTLDLTATYTITVDAVAVAYDAASELPLDLADLLAGIANAINDDVGASAIVSAVLEDQDADGIVDTIVLSNTTGTDNAHTTALATTGTAIMVMTEDAITAGVRVWFLPDTTGDGLTLPWVCVNAADYTIDHRGFVERFETAGARRVYMEAFDVVDSGSAAPSPSLIIAIGPGGIES